MSLIPPVQGENPMNNGDGVILIGSLSIEPSNFDENSVSSGSVVMMSTPDVLTVDSNELPSQFSAPDVMESDPEILKAELSFFTTPHQEDYRDAVYGTLKNIESTCQMDYATMCSTAASSPSGGADVELLSLPEFMSQMGFGMPGVDFERRRLTHVNGGNNAAKHGIAENIHELLLDPIGVVKRSLAISIPPFSFKDKRGITPVIKAEPTGPHPMPGGPMNMPGHMQSPPSPPMMRESPMPPRSGGPLFNAPHNGNLPSTPRNSALLPSASMNRVELLKQSGGNRVSAGHRRLRGDGEGASWGMGMHMDGGHMGMGMGKGGYHSDSDSDSDSDEEEDEKDKKQSGSSEGSAGKKPCNHHHDHGDHLPGPPGPPGGIDGDGMPLDAEDTLFDGSMGYGPFGDICMYQNFDKLSLPCQASIADLHDLREQYWSEDMAHERMERWRRGHHDHFLMPLFILMAVLGGVIAMKGMRKLRNKRLAIVNTLAAIERNPALKAQVEAESGVPLPTIMMEGRRPAGFNVLAFIGTIILALITGMVVAITSVLIASGIVVGLGRPDPAAGDVRYPSPEAAFGILLGVTLVEVIGVALIVKVFKRMRINNAREAALRAQPSLMAPANARASASASAPTMAAVFATTGTVGGNGNGSGSCGNCGRSGCNGSCTQGGKVDTVAVMSTATPTTATTTTGTHQAQQSVSAALDSVRRGLTGLARNLPLPGSSTAVAAEGGYTVLPADDVAHMAIVTGIPVTAQQQRGGVNHYI